MKRITLYIPELLIVRLRALQQRTGIRWQAQIRNAVVEYLEKKEKNHG